MQSFILTPWQCSWGLSTALSLSPQHVLKLRATTQPLRVSAGWIMWWLCFHHSFQSMLEAPAEYHTRLGVGAALFPLGDVYETSTSVDICCQFLLVSSPKMWRLKRHLSVTRRSGQTVLLRSSLCTWRETLTAINVKESPGKMTFWQN